MNTSNAAVQNSKTKAQQGFSLIELLVVVAIIGVLAAAGIVGYTSYLEGVKSDTHKNNVISLKKGLDVIAVARGGGLTVNPSQCNTEGTNVPTAAAAYDLTTLGKVVTCVNQVAVDGKFKSPIVPPANPTDAYVVISATVPVTGTTYGCTDLTKGLIVVSNTGNVGEIRLAACDKDGTKVIHNETIALK